MLAETARSERAVTSGCERAHSATSAASTPSCAASARIASSRACEPLFQPAYAILIAEAAPTGPSSTIASSRLPLKRAATSAAPGRRRVASRRPADAQLTREPPARAAAATELPISPGCRIPIVVTAASLAHSSLRRAARTAKHGARPLRRLHEAARQQQHDGHEERAEDQQVNVDPVQREVLLEDDVEHGPEHRPLERAHAADARHQQRVE